MKHNPAKYDVCECGGRIIEKEITVDFRYKGRLFEFEHVPVGVCLECGQRIYKGPVLENLERLARGKTKPKRIIKVPVADYRLVKPAGF